MSEAGAESVDNAPAVSSGKYFKQKSLPMNLAATVGDCFVYNGYVEWADVGLEQPSPWSDITSQGRRQMILTVTGRVSLMDKRAWVGCALLFLQTLLYRTTSANSGYLVVLPSTFRPSVEEVLSVTILQPTEPIFVEAKLFSKRGHLLTQTGHEIFGKGTVKLKIPSHAEGLYNLKICGNCNPVRAGAYSFYNSSVVRVDRKGSSVFIQTDKPIYKPQQTVNINVITTGPDLRPTNPKLTLSVADPNQSTITKWTDVEPLCCGIVNVSMPLSEQPVLGTWTVTAVVQGHSYTRQFDVQRYVLPKFEVSVQAPEYIREWTTCEKVFVHARYTFGQNVRGVVELQYSIKGIGYYSDHYSPIHTVNSKIYGTTSFDICISDLVSQKFPDHFRGQLHLEAQVATPDGSTMGASDQSCPVNKQLVDLLFSKDTRTNFKPGLPFKGRVLVQYPDGSHADNVTVLVEATVDGADFSRQTIITEDGHASFFLPALPTVAQSMTLNARVRSIGDEATPDFYFSAYQTVHSSYSPSKCHLLIDSRSPTYEAGEEGQYLIYSTCPCNLDMYYEVKARGNLVHSGIHFARHERKQGPLSGTDSKLPAFLQGQENAVLPETYGAKTCTVLIKFLITHEMSPYSHLLVYYVRPGGEGVADAIMFPVQPKFRNHMSMELSEQVAMPGENIKVRVDTRPGSCVCLAAVDKSVQLLRPGYLLTENEIFEEMDSYEDIADEESSSQYGPSGDHSHRIIRSSWQPTQRGVRDAHYAFEECGLLVMTDTVNLQFKQTSHVESESSYAYQIAQLIASQKKLIQKKRSRVYFPETWIWKCFNASTTRKHQALVAEVPDSITTWVFSGVSLSPTKGLALAPPTSLRSFQYFFLDLSLPYSVVRHEQVRIPLVVHNYLHACIRVHLQIDTPNTLELVQQSEIQKKFCIGTDETKTLFYDIVFNAIGTQKVSATAEAYADSRCCSGILTEENPSRHLLTGADSVKQQVLVVAEGITKYYTQSVYFCPNSRIQLSTPNRYEFQYISRPSDMVTFTFLVKAKNDVRVALSPGPKANDELIEIVLGGAFNKQSWIVLSETEVVNTSTPGVVSDEEFRPFWISWKDTVVMVGHGNNVGDNETVLLKYTPERSIFVEYIGFSTGWGSEGEFQIWKKTKQESSGYGEVMYLSLPDATIPGSAFAKTKLTGNLMGPSLEQLDKLLRLPQGCGEQNMANFAPNVYILEYLDKTQQLESELKLKVIKLLIKGYQKQLTYKRQDGSYSAFGHRDSSGSTWLSAFVLKTYAQARPYVFIDETELETTRRWLVDKQGPDGSFESVGRIINKEIQGGVTDRLALTAYVLTALYQAGVQFELDTAVAQDALGYLEDNVNLVEDPYTAAMLAYTLNLFKSDRAHTMLKKLSEMAIKKNGMMFWKLYNHDVHQFVLFHEEPFRGKVSSAEIEIAGYAALAYLIKQDLSSAFPIMKWLTAQRNSLGGFSSTQDTVVALQALSSYAIQSHSDVLDMTVSLASTNMDLHERIELTVNNTNVVHTAGVPSLPAGLFLSATGEGCAMFQAEVQYNVPDPNNHPAFDLTISLLRQTSTNGQSYGFIKQVEDTITFETCTKWLRSGSSNMAVMEISMLTGYQVDPESLERLLDDPIIKLKRYELTGRDVILYFDEIRSTCLTCVKFEMTHDFDVEDGQSVSLRIYDYYEPSNEAEILYGVADIQNSTADTNISDSCSTLLGCEVSRCTCRQECPYKTPTCASDGVVYPSPCHMERQACTQGTNLQQMPLQHCEVLPRDGSGDVFDWRDELLPSINATHDDNFTGPIDDNTTFKFNRTISEFDQQPTVDFLDELFIINSTSEDTVVKVSEDESATELTTESNTFAGGHDIWLSTNNAPDIVGQTMIVSKTTSAYDVSRGNRGMAQTPSMTYEDNVIVETWYGDPAASYAEGVVTEDTVALKGTNASEEDERSTQAYVPNKVIKTNKNENELKYKLPPDIHLVKKQDRGQLTKDKQAQMYDRRPFPDFPNKLIAILRDHSHQGESKDIGNIKLPEKHHLSDEAMQSSYNTPVTRAHGSYYDADTAYMVPTISLLETKPSTEDHERDLDDINIEDLTDREFLDMMAMYYDFASMDIPSKRQPPKKDEDLMVSDIEESGTLVFNHIEDHYFAKQRVNSLKGKGEILHLDGKDSPENFTKSEHLMENTSNSTAHEDLGEESLTTPEHSTTYVVNQSTDDTGQSVGSMVTTGTSNIDTATGQEITNDLHGTNYDSTKTQPTEDTSRQVSTADAALSTPRDQT